MTEMHKRKISETLRGKPKPPRSRAHCLAISKANHGLSRNKGIPKSPEHKAKIAKARALQPPTMLGKHHTAKTKQAISLAHKGKNIGDKNPNWRGGVTKPNAAIRNSRKYIAWRKAVIKRDNHQCTQCRATKGLVAHHIKAFALYPELRFNIDNGITLCKKCHIQTNNYAGRSLTC